MALLAGSPCLTHRHGSPPQTRAAASSRCRVPPTLQKASPKTAVARYLIGGGNLGLLSDLNKVAKGLSDLPVDEAHPEKTFYDPQYWIAVSNNAVIQVFTFPSCQAWALELLDAL